MPGRRFFSLLRARGSRLNPGLLGTAICLGTLLPHLCHRGLRSKTLYDHKDREVGLRRSRAPVTMQSDG